MCQLVTCPPLDLFVWLIQSNSFCFLKCSLEPALAAHAFNHSTGDRGKADLCGSQCYLLVYRLEDSLGRLLTMACNHIADLISAQEA